MSIKRPNSRIDKRAIKAWQITGVLFFLPFMIAYTALYLFVDEFAGLFPNLELISSLVFAFFLSLILGMPVIRWRRWHYEINEDEIDIIRGIIIERRTLIPINRIQHVDNRQGPIYKMFGLSSVTVSTAASTHEIPALNDDIADQVRHNISTFVNQAKEDV